MPKPTISKKAERALNMFERAAIRREDLGAIPLFSDDPEEQRDITRERAAIQRGYTRARNRLIEIISKEKAS